VSAATHTPGPWEARASTDTVDYGIVVRDARAKDGWAVIAEAFSEIRHAGERAPEALHNARLIAAAPKMLQELRAARAYIQKQCNCLHDSHVNPSTGKLVPADVMDEDLALLRRIDAAIAAATGSTP
jgi:hypothetical protein